MKKIIDSINWFLMPIIRVLSRLNTQRVVRNKIRIRRDDAQVKLIENTLKKCISQARYQGRCSLITNYSTALSELRSKFPQKDFKDIQEKIEAAEADAVKDRIEIAEFEAFEVELNAVIEHYYTLEKEINDPASRMSRLLLREK